MRCKKRDTVYRSASQESKKTQSCGKCRRGFSTKPGSRITIGDTT